MKKWLFLLIVFACCLFFKPNQEQTHTVAFIQDETNNIVKEYIIDCEKENIHTKNLTQYFEKETITKIIPYINPIYQDKLNHMEYEITTNNFETSIQKFTTKYLNKIKEFSITDYNIMYINGIKLKKIKLQITKQQLETILKNYPNLTYTIE